MGSQSAAAGTGAWHAADESFRGMKQLGQRLSGGMWFCIRHCLHKAGTCRACGVARFKRFKGHTVRKQCREYRQESETCMACLLGSVQLLLRF